ncbi:MAG TPA: hypothetical protein VJ867_13490 [Gemmatimonadaceae bacterium]|nr:hypothetical protein [Gemmatimonadaceae bacterium]
MRLQRLILSAAISAPLVLGTASLAAAQNRQLFTWSGRVDREVQLVMRGRDLWTRAGGRDDGDRNRTRVESGLPRTAGVVHVQLVQGRGDVAVIQQPSARNDYTAIVRVRDRSGGSDRYRVTANWESYYRNGRDGDWDRSDDGDWDRGGNDRAGSRIPRVEPRDRSNDGGWNNGSRSALRWSGAVDDEVEIRIQGRRVDYRTLSGAGTREVRSQVVGDGLPYRDAQIVVSQRQGRGSVFVVQQPSSRNGYTAVLRVRDPQGGFGYYDFDVSWR